METNNRIFIRMAEMRIWPVLISLAAVCNSCEIIDHTGEDVVQRPDKVELCMGEVAEILAEMPIALQQMKEVHDAVSSSSGNGYDDEYTMKDLFRSPGSGVGEDAVKSGSGDKSYERPLKDLFAEYFAATQTKSAAGGPSPEEYLQALSSSDMQIYWPYHEDWDSKDLPVITFDPEDGSEKNIGYQIIAGADGSRKIEEVVVDEKMARKRPVWIVNRNDDSGYNSIEMLRRKDPDWGTGGGEIIIGAKNATENNSSATKGGTGTPKLRSLILKDFKMLRNYDPWFAGASEFFVKCGSVEDFTATTEAELKVYNPSVTDFMIVVKRNQVGELRPFNALLVSKWTDQLENCAFMITEDDGGTRNSWKCEANVMIKSKRYGFDMSLPFNSRDDIVWRGKLSGQYLEAYSGKTSRFGDINLTFEIIEK